MKTKILIVEDQFIEANNLQRILERAGYSVCSIARSVSIALKILDRENPDLVLLDIYLQGSLNGIDLAKKLRDKNLPFVYISANSNKQVFNEAKATKPYGFLVKPFREKDVLVMLDVALYLHQQNNFAADQKLKGIGAKSDSTADFSPLTGVIGKSPKILEVLEQVKIVGNSETSVLILGESGTGKELIAQGIHSISSRKKKPIVVVNCAALPANLIESELFGHEKGSFTGAFNKKIGKFEQADGGTIFLDEIGELPLDLQVKFLRVLQERVVESIGGIPKKINVRVVAATNKNLEEEVAAGRFRIDLYYRLNVFPIILPSLSERKEDIPLLARHFLNYYARRENKTINGFSDEVLNSISNYSWPGNVRELENLMERSVLLTKGTVVDKIVLPNEYRKSLSVVDIEKLETMEENERAHIIKVLKKCEGKIYGPGGAAEMLDMNVSTLNSRIKKLGIDKH